LGPAIPASEYHSLPHAKAIAEAARRLDHLRQSWLNPSDLIQQVPEVVTSFPDRLMPIDEKAEVELKKRTLTKLYNANPTWLTDAHEQLDRAVGAAYGWLPQISEEEALKELLQLNHEKAKLVGTATPVVIGEEGKDDDDDDSDDPE
jgi:hypothetical protein